MKIYLNRGDFFTRLFPERVSSDADLIAYLKEYYSVMDIEPHVEIDGEVVIVDINVDSIQNQNSIYSDLVKSVEAGDYKKGETLAKELTTLNPHVSEYHRMLGQVYYESNQSEKAMNSLIEALRWDPKNTYALVLMGNLHSMYKKDVDTAMLFYNKALEKKSDDFLALGNIGANLLKLGKYDEAKSFLKRAIEINPKYPNAYLGMAYVTKEENDLNESFEYALKFLQVGEFSYDRNRKEIETVLQIAKDIVQVEKALNWIEVFKEALEEKTGREIRVQKTSALTTSAKIEYAENYNREYHLLKYKPDKPAYEHLILHELVHLELAEEARAKSANQLFVSGAKEERRFKHSLSKFIKRLTKRGVPKDSIRKYIDSLFQGINSQAFNTPIDLFIEDRIYQYYPTLRPFQFLSLLAMVLEGAEAVTREDIVKNSPKDIISKSKIYNLINALHFKNLYHIDLTSNHKPSKSQLETAKSLYKGFLAIRDDKKPGQEYDLVYAWAKSLQNHRYFSLVDESEFRSHNEQSISPKRPDSNKSLDQDIEDRVQKFVESHEDDINMAVVVHMISALSYFKSMTKEQIKTIAFDLAHLGQSGIDPKKDGYHVSSIPESNFSGYKTLAYYYVSWALAIPEMLSQLGMPFDQEFEVAQKLERGTNG